MFADAGAGAGAQAQAPAVDACAAAAAQNAVVPSLLARTHSSWRQRHPHRSSITRERRHRRRRRRHPSARRAAALAIAAAFDALLPLAEPPLHAAGTKRRHSAHSDESRKRLRSGPRDNADACPAAAADAVSASAMGDEPAAPPESAPLCDARTPQACANAPSALVRAAGPSAAACFQSGQQRRRRVSLCKRQTVHNVQLMLALFKAVPIVLKSDIADILAQPTAVANALVREMCIAHGQRPGVEQKGRRVLLSCAVLRTGDAAADAAYAARVYGALGRCRTALKEKSGVYTAHEQAAIAGLLRDHLPVQLDSTPLKRARERYKQEKRREATRRCNARTKPCGWRFVDGDARVPLLFGEYYECAAFADAALAAALEYIAPAARYSMTSPPADLLERKRMLAIGCAYYSPSVTGGAPAITATFTVDDDEAAKARAPCADDDPDTGSPWSFLSSVVSVQLFLPPEGRLVGHMTLKGNAFSAHIARRMAEEMRCLCARLGMKFTTGVPMLMCHTTTFDMGVDINLRQRALDYRELIVSHAAQTGVAVTNTDLFDSSRKLTKFPSRSSFQMACTDDTGVVRLFSTSVMTSGKVSILSNLPVRHTESAARHMHAFLVGYAETVRTKRRKVIAAGVTPTAFYCAPRNSSWEALGWEDTPVSGPQRAAEPGVGSATHEAALGCVHSASTPHAACGSVLEASSQTVSPVRVSVAPGSSVSWCGTGSAGSMHPMFDDSVIMELG